jgi:hypothetical protein
VVVRGVTCVGSSYVASAFASWHLRERYLEFANPVGEIYVKHPLQGG